MKKTLSFIAILFMCNLLFGQNDTTHMRTLLKHKKGSTFLVAQKFQFTVFDSRPTFMIGAGGGKIFKHNFLLGGGGYGTLVGIPVKEKNYEPLDLQQNISHNLHFGYGGFWTGYMINWHAPVHLTPSMFWAMGAVSIRRNDTEESVHTNLVYILQPMLELEINFNEFVRIGLAPEYRFVGNVKLDGYKSSNFSGFGAVFFIKFGAF